ncbi:MAG: ABC transporter substrate-binding protein, partial [Pseudobdellovibrio sp.]
GKTVSIYSIDKANKLLDEAGWKMNAQKLREKNGKVLEFTFKTSAGLKVLENIQVVVCDKFKSIGARCNIKNEPPRALLGQSVPHGEFDLTMFGQPLPIDTSITSYFSSKEIPTSQNSWAGGNQIRLSSPEVDKLLFDFDHEFSYAKRNTIIKKIEQTFLNQYFLIPLYHRREAVVLPKNLKGVTDSFEGTAFNTPENWSL